MFDARPLACALAAVLGGGDAAESKMLKEKTNMARYLVERTFPDGLAIPMTDEGAQVCLTVVGNNAVDGVADQRHVIPDDSSQFILEKVDDVAFIIGFFLPFRSGTGQERIPSIEQEMGAVLPTASVFPYVAGGSYEGILSLGPPGGLKGIRSFHNLGRMLHSLTYVP